MSFTDLHLIEPLLIALEKNKYTKPSPIQMQCIPHILNGKDIFGCAQTGTGKTAAFALPILQLLESKKNPEVARKVKTLVLAPTRELASQIRKTKSVRLATPSVENRNFLWLSFLNMIYPCGLINLVYGRNAVIV